MGNLQVEDTLQPPPWLRKPLLQTVLGAKIAPGGAEVRVSERPILVDAGPDVTGFEPQRHVRLLAYYNARLPSVEPRGAAVLLHGWEGSSHAPYNLMLTRVLTEAGYDVFRLNLRDHGPNLHFNAYALNRGFFLGTLIEETECAVRRLADMVGDSPLALVGCSMGGNFVLRLGIRSGAHPIPNLRHVVAVNPVISPLRCMRSVDQKDVYRRFFRSRWLRSLLAKQKLFPDAYDFTPLIGMPAMMDMTEYIVPRYTPWRDAEDYFNHYAVSSSALDGLGANATILTAFDDEIVPVADIYALGPHPRLTVRILRHGGHVGYLADVPLRRRLGDLVLEAMEQMQGEAIPGSTGIVVESGAPLGPGSPVDAPAARSGRPHG